MAPFRRFRTGKRRHRPIWPPGLILRPLGIDDQKLQHTLIHQEKVAIMPGEIPMAQKAAGDGAFECRMPSPETLKRRQRIDAGPQSFADTVCCGGVDPYPERRIMYIRPL